jgi:hypothetical protein
VRGKKLFSGSGGVSVEMWQSSWCTIWTIRKSDCKIQKLLTFFASGNIETFISARCWVVFASTTGDGHILGLRPINWYHFWPQLDLVSEYLRDDQTDPWFFFIVLVWHFLVLSIVHVLVWNLCTFSQDIQLTVLPRNCWSIHGQFYILLVKLAHTIVECTAVID